MVELETGHLSGLILLLLFRYLSVAFTQGSSERLERSVRFNPNLRSERVRFFSERETNLHALALEKVLTSSSGTFSHLLTPVIL